MAESYELARSHITVALNLLEGLGFSVNYECLSMLITSKVPLHKSRTKKLIVVEVLYYNYVNMRVVTSKKTIAKMGLLHSNTPMYDFLFGVS